MIGRIAAIASISTLIVAISIALLISFWLLYPYEVIVYSASQFPTDKTEYIQGEHVSFKVDYCKKLPIIGQVSRALVDGVRISYPTVNSNLAAGCSSYWMSDLKIPTYTPAGIYHVELSIEYKVNPIRTITVDHSTVSFNIVERDTDRLEELQSQIDDNSQTTLDNTIRLMHIRKSLKDRGIK